MAYQKTVWVNDSLPAINAENLNKIEEGIEANETLINSLHDPRGFIKDDYITDNGDGTIDIELGQMSVVAILSSDGGYMAFSLPIGRVLPKDTIITRMRGSMGARATNAAGTGVYVIKATSGGYGYAPFDTDNAQWADFYDGANNHRTPSIKPVLALNGGCSVYFTFASGTANYISGSATLTSNLNNNAMIVTIADCVITAQLPE